MSSDTQDEGVEILKRFLILDLCFKEECEAENGILDVVSQMIKKEKDPEINK